MAMQITVPDGLFGNKTVAYIEDDGDITVDDGIFGRKIVAHIDERGSITVSDGAFTRKEVARFQDGKVTTSDGLFSRKEVANVSDGGNIYQGSGFGAKRVGRLEGYKDDSSPSASGGSSESSSFLAVGGLLLGLAIIAVVGGEIALLAGVIPLRRFIDLEFEEAIMLYAPVVIALVIGVAITIKIHAGFLDAFKSVYSSQIAVAFVVALIEAIATKGEEIWWYLALILGYPYLTAVMLLIPSLVVTGLLTAVLNLKDR